MEKVFFLWSIVAGGNVYHFQHAMPMALTGIKEIYENHMSYVIQSIEADMNSFRHSLGTDSVDYRLAISVST